MTFNQIFFVDYIFIFILSATPLLGGVAPGGVAVERSFTYLSHLFTDLDETNVIQSEIFHRLHIYSFLKRQTPSRGCGTWV